MANPRETRASSVVIVGGGIAGLSAGWRLLRRGVGDFVVLELERTAGGNSRGGENEVASYPWAAHYVPIPDEKATLVRELFTELGVLRDGAWDERYLCFSPQERLFMHGRWHEGVEPTDAIDRAGRAQFARFDEEVAAARASGEFTIPMARGARASSPLDGSSVRQWMDSRGLTYPALRWYVDYACRDDYGSGLSDTSAWAGMHYFASRPGADQGPLTWPEGNAWIARRLSTMLGSRVAPDSPATRIERVGAKWHVVTATVRHVADAVIFAAPSFLLPYLVPAMRGRTPPLAYSPWLTANLTLDRQPKESSRSVPPSWDNVIYGSPSLGYVDATHQSLATHREKTVWTYYWALAEHSPADGRRLLQQRSWSEWVELIMSDLERAHPDIRACVARIDIMRMGHAMVRPTPGFLRSTASLRALSGNGFHLANSDLSGLSLFEEAQFRGCAAADAAIAGR